MAEDKIRIGVCFVLGAHFIFQKMVVVAAICSIFKMYLAQKWFCHLCYSAFLSVFIKGEAFRQPYTDDSEKLMFWGEQWPQSKPSPRWNKPLPLREGILYRLNVLSDFWLQLEEFLILIRGLWKKNCFRNRDCSLITNTQQEEHELRIQLWERVKETHSWWGSQGLWANRGISWTLIGAFPTPAWWSILGMSSEGWCDFCTDHLSIPGCSWSLGRAELWQCCRELLAPHAVWDSLNKLRAVIGVPLSASVASSCLAPESQVWRNRSTATQREVFWMHDCEAEARKTLMDQSRHLIWKFLFYSASTSL